MKDFIQTYPNFLPDDEYRKLSAALYDLQDHICVDNNKSYEAEAILRKRKLDNICDTYAFYRYYLDQVLKPECNVFFQDVLFLRENKNGIPKHVDTQVADRLLEINHDTDYVPICVNIFYVNVPEDLQGGELIIDNHSAIRPANNTLVEFSGYSLAHCVKPFTTHSRRCMLVTEQCSFNSTDLILHGSKIETPFTVNEIKKDRYGNFE